MRAKFHSRMSASLEIGKQGGIAATTMGKSF
jgi:hypothetical protein